ncbi:MULTISPECIES: SPFH domain-containing protein [unclassified Haladaptatus]|uniref:SPFH domain-containing protein n=1 Tax=unclassified Haladaptatus TaxID=2622732 RepID=UPI00209C45EC|nr:MULTISPECIES: SPFH domain-containing protein [unclassified Haladaptatus]MCO8242876.1 SPFH/Band 7/PHB domain protein [Haladaptatus sp. AB643]MCO8252636.1 SPFH/Band 7/PHB domain protein [Haladaptatus sp. AB618]
MDNPFYVLGKLSSGTSAGKSLFAVGFVAFFFLALPFLDTTAIAGLLILVLAAATVNSAIEIVGPYEKRVLTVFGEYRRLLDPGIHFVPPFVSATHRFDMRTRVFDVPKQEAITKDNSPVIADAVLYVRVMDAKRAFLGVNDYERAVSNLGQTTLRAVLGDMKLDETLSRRDVINTRIREEIDPPTDEWGIRVESVEVREVMPSRSVVGAMEQQTSAERQRRAMILEAQGRRRGAIERAEGEKTANITRAQGEKQSQILEAQGDAVSTVLRAKSAESMGERAVIDRGLETLRSVGESKSSTFVFPQELSSLLGRYGKHLSGSDVREDTILLESNTFDTETRELLGLDDVDEMLVELDTQMDESSQLGGKTATESD